MLATLSARAVAAEPPAATPAPAPAPAVEGPAPEAPMKDEARARYERGLERYQAKDYAAAIRELEAGYAIDPRREFLFAEAQAQRLAGDCRAAVPLYQRFLATSPPAVQASAAQIALGRCAEMLAAARAEPQSPRPPPPPPAPPPPRWSRDPLGLGLFIAGAAAVVTGGVLLGASFATSTDGATLDDYRRQRDREVTLGTAGVATLGLGAALLAGSGWRYVQLRRQANASVLVVGGTF